nr:MAG TPA_asm: hypothetical protein [Caudoviricetes sp.]
MIIKYTRNLSQECEFKIDRADLEREYDGDVKLAIQSLDKHIKAKSTYDVDFDDVEYELNADDKEYERALHLENLYGQDAIEAAYWLDVYGGLS